MKKYHIITIGCQMNKSDSERIAGMLEKNDYQRSDNKYQADLVVVNTCGVRQTAEDRLYGLVAEIKKVNSKCFIVITGCLIYRQDIKKRMERFVNKWIPITEMTNVKFLMAKIPLTHFIKEKNSNLDFLTNREQCSDYFKIIPKYLSKFSAFVPIGNGCNNFCSYCVVPYARGREVYRPVEDILSEVESLVNRGYKEIILIAQNVNSYNSKFSISNFQFSDKSKIKNLKSKIINFANLLKMVNNIQGDFWIRFLTSHPKDMSNKLIKTIVSCKKICHHIHLPVQSGDDEILKKMNRKYSVEHYINLIKKIREVMPDSSITTDIIVGFPGETKKQFNNTVKLFKQIKFDMAYISLYSPRSGTVSFKMDDNIFKEEKKNRENELLKILSKTALANNKKYKNKIVKVLVEGERKTGELFGKTATGKNIRILNKNVKCKVGDFVEIKITEVKNSCLAGDKNAE